MKERRFGKFYINLKLFEHNEIFLVLEKLQFVPYRAEWLQFRGEIEYIGHSPLFEVTSKFTEIPIYRIIVHEQERGTIKVEVERQ